MMLTYSNEAIERVRGRNRTVFTDVASVTFSRLDLQHYHWRETLGHLIHPDIPTHAENLQILDIACGTG